jgi:tetratricopeptide (TPR) repeat protein
MRNEPERLTGDFLLIVLIGLIALCTLFGSSDVSFAGTEVVLFLKNGRQIVVDRYWETGEQVFYERNGSRFGFPRRLLDRVGGEAEEDNGSQGTSQEAPVEGYRNEVETNAIEAARQASRDGNLDEAIRQYRKALEAEPTAVATRVELAVLCFENGDLYTAESELERAKRATPEDPRVRELLGDVYYRMGRTPLAIREWQAALPSNTSPGLLYKLKKALTENDEDINFDDVDRPHFLIRYEGTVEETIGRVVASALESEYYDLSRELHFTPGSPVKVMLYTNQEFLDATRAPTWVSGLNDGEIRVPVEGLSEMTPKLRRILRHELTHSFVNAMTGGNCPSWFHEGLAQLREGSDHTDPYPRLSAARADGSLMPLWTLEGPLLNESRDKALLAYAQALSATEYLAARKGHAALLQILRLLSERYTMGDALKRVVGLDYREFQTAWEADLDRYSLRGR